MTPDHTNSEVLPPIDETIAKVLGWEWHPEKYHWWRPPTEGVWAMVVPPYLSNATPTTEFECFDYARKNSMGKIFWDNFLAIIAGRMAELGILADLHYVPWAMFQFYELGDYATALYGALEQQRAQRQAWKNGKL